MNIANRKYAKLMRYRHELQNKTTKPKELKREPSKEKYHFIKYQCSER